MKLKGSHLQCGLYLGQDCCSATTSLRPKQSKERVESRFLLWFFLTPFELPSPARTKDRGISLFCVSRLRDSISFGFGSIKFELASRGTGSSLGLNKSAKY